MERGSRVIRAGPVKNPPVPKRCSACSTETRALSFFFDRARVVLYLYPEQPLREQADYEGDRRHGQHDAERMKRVLCLFDIRLGKAAKRMLRRRFGGRCLMYD